MQNKIIIIGKEAVDKMLQGVNELADIVSMTLGPAGKTVVIQDQFDQPKVTKDGVTVARHVSFSDPIKNSGAAIVLQAAKRTVEEVGDGTTTATVLAQKITNDAIKAVQEGASPRDLIAGMKDAQNRIIEAVKRQSIPATEELLVGIATTSMNGDKAIGEIIGKSMWEMGSTASFNVEDGHTPGVYVDMIKGIRFDRGFQHPLFINTPEKGSADHKNPKILLTDMKIDTIPQAVMDIMSECAQAGIPFIIMCEEMKTSALQTILYNVKRGLQLSVVKVPAFGHGKIAVLEDLAALLGGKVISEQRGERLTNAKVTHLGSCERMISTKNHTIIYGGGGSKEALEERFAIMRNTIDTTTDTMEKFVVENRYKRLRGGLMVVKVAGETPSETQELRDRVDDALHAVKAAYTDGISVGGGKALVNAVHSCTFGQMDKSSYKIGMNIVGAACYILTFKMAENAGMTFVIPDHEEPTCGIDFTTGESCNLVEKGIVDPTSSSINALQNAVSVAVTLLNIGGAVVNDENDVHIGGPAFNFNNGGEQENNI